MFREESMVIGFDSSWVVGVMFKISVTQNFNCFFTPFSIIIISCYSSTEKISNGIKLFRHILLDVYRYSSYEERVWKFKLFLYLKKKMSCRFILYRAYSNIQIIYLFFCQQNTYNDSGSCDCYLWFILQLRSAEKMLTMPYNWG